MELCFSISVEPCLLFAYTQSKDIDEGSDQNVDGALVDTSALVFIGGI